MLLFYCEHGVIWHPIETAIWIAQEKDDSKVKHSWLISAELFQ